MSAISSQHPKYRTKLCRNFTSGNCPFGPKCSFVHPGPLGTHPLASSLAQYLFNWNALLPQLLALSNQQATLKGMQRRSPPRPQGAQLIDEGPSPPVSLLLSTSDCTSSEQASQTRRFARRKKSPCRQFVRTGGWCPVGANCRFYHDATALPPADRRKVERSPPYETDVPKVGGRTISGGVLMGIQLPSPPAVNQECSKPPRYTEAEPAQPCHPSRYPYLNATDHGHFVDQPVYWPGYTWQPYYATVSPATVAPASTSIAPPSPMQDATHRPSPQFPVQSVPPAETRTSLPLGTYEVNGTTYFPTQMPSVIAPAPVTCSVPVPPASYSHAMAPVYPYYAAPPPASYYDVPDQLADGRWQACFDPFFSDPTMPSVLPVASRQGDYCVSPVQYDGVARALAGDVRSMLTTNAVDKPVSTVTDLKDQEFPYHPPKNQQVGHARRISVNVKKHGRTTSD